MILAGLVGKSQDSDILNMVNSIFRNSGLSAGIIRPGTDPSAAASANAWDIAVEPLEPGRVFPPMPGSRKFDVIIVAGDIADPYVFERLAPEGLIVINDDNPGLESIRLRQKQNIVTYGFGSDSSVTTSSTGDTVCKDNILCSVQKSVPTLSGKLAAPGDYKLGVPGEETNEYDIMAAATFAIVSGIDPSGFK